MLNLIDNFELGEIPQSLEDLTSVGKAIIKVNNKTAQTLAIIVASGRKYLDLRAWGDWCAEEFGIDNVCYRSHLCKVGEMLNALINNDVVCYKKVFGLAFEKLLSLSRLKVEEVPAFVSDNTPLDNKSREEVRFLVNQFLGIEQAEVKVKQNNLPGFDEAVSAIASLDGNRFKSIIEDSNKAAESTYASLGLLGASMEYYKTTKSYSNENLIAIKSALLDEIENIDNLLNEEITL